MLSMEINEEVQMKQAIGYDYDTMIRQANEHSYIVSFDKLHQETTYHSEKSTLTDIHTDFIRNKENLITNEGFIHIKEYTIDSNQCRCHEHNDLLHDEQFDNIKHLSDYKLEV
ncbi:unnamed protein product [Adineta steineri]|uniref:Uncharacterized protein n=1 Tax=Adineta steineri TaxID=433720 RepID=A0A815S5L9_9BILA|nr:unnamed protein product [Adineta steineri]CAF1051273.1 unnamed protein product [Adineta steineri]CAF1484591.1 unnamed protein product [Adineta steineri]CAF3608209.1 unnamed protein product [Adineta steineri]CAF3611242.1 unnamed protein product [Adineta steineri]